MKKFIIFGIALFIALNPALIYAEELVTEGAIEAAGSWDPTTVLDYAWRFLAVVAFGFTTYLARNARRFLLNLTPEKTIELISGSLERIGRSPEKLRVILDALIQVPLVREKFNESKLFIDTRIHEIDDRLLDYRIKLESGLLTDEQAAAVQELIGKLFDEKQKLIEEHAKTNS